MRMTIDIDDKELLQIQKATGVRKKSPAVRRALQDYLKEQEKKRFLKDVLEGKCDYPLTNEELEARGVYDSD